MSTKRTLRPYLLDVSGCDDVTRIRLEFTELEAAFVEKLFAAISRHGGGCQPTARIHLEGAGKYDQFALDEYAREEL